MHGRRSRRRRAGPGATTVIALAALLSIPAAGTAGAAEPERLTIDLATDTGAFHGGASGSLYGVYGDGVPSRNVLEGMHVRTVSTKAQDGPQHPGADALEMLPPFVDAGGKDVYIYMPDIYRGFPYEWRTSSAPGTGLATRRPAGSREALSPSRHAMRVPSSWRLTASAPPG